MQAVSWKQRSAQSSAEAARRGSPALMLPPCRPAPPRGLSKTQAARGEGSLTWSLVQGSFRWGKGTGVSVGAKGSGRGREASAVVVFSIGVLVSHFRCVPVVPLLRRVRVVVAVTVGPSTSA